MTSKIFGCTTTVDIIDVIKCETYNCFYLSFPDKVFLYDSSYSNGDTAIDIRIKYGMIACFVRGYVYYKSYTEVKEWIQSCFRRIVREIECAKMISLRQISHLIPDEIEYEIKMYLQSPELFGNIIYQKREIGVIIEGVVI